MESAVTPANADVLPLIDRLGPRPFALAAYDDNELARTENGLAVTFSFLGCVGMQPARDALRYCAQAFQQLGFRLDPAQADRAQPRYRQDGLASTTAVTLHIPADGLVRRSFVQVEQRDFERRETVHHYDDVEAQWKALRVIRQAAALKRAGQVAFS